MAQRKSSIGIDTVSLVSLSVESTLYGLFIALFIPSTFILLRKSKTSRSKINKPMLFASFTMFILASVHIGTDIRRILDAFIGYSHRGGPDVLLGQVSAPIYLLKSTAYAMQTLVGDAFILYRLYLVWNGDRRIVFPILICFITSIGVGIGALQAFAKASPEAPVFISDLQHWIVSFFSLTLFTNFSCTTLIAFRVWWMHRQTKSLLKEGHSVLPAMVVIIESGSIYSACLVILLTLYLAGNFAQYILLDAVTQVIGIVFSLVIVRVALGISIDLTTAKTTAKLTTFGAMDPSGTTSDNSEPETVVNLTPIRVAKVKTEFKAYV